MHRELFKFAASLEFSGCEIDAPVSEHLYWNNMRNMPNREVLANPRLLQDPSKSVLYAEGFSFGPAGFERNSLDRSSNLRFQVRDNPRRLDIARSLALSRWMFGDR